MFARTGFGEEGIEGVITSSDSHIGRHLTIRLDAMFQAIQFPTGTEKSF
jgi:hypothetical protein